MTLLVCHHHHHHLNPACPSDPWYPCHVPVPTTTDHYRLLSTVSELPMPITPYLIVLVLSDKKPYEKSVTRDIATSYLCSMYMQAAHYSRYLNLCCKDDDSREGLGFSTPISTNQTFTLVRFVDCKLHSGTLMNRSSYH